LIWVDVPGQIVGERWVRLMAPGECPAAAAGKLAERSARAATPVVGIGPRVAPSDEWTPSTNWMRAHAIDASPEVRGRGPRVRTAEKDRSYRGAWRPLCHSCPAWPNHPASEGRPIMEEAAGIAALRVPADASVDHTEARNDILGCFGRSGPKRATLELIRLSWRTIG
jgi:hypothetical protein